MYKYVKITYAISLLLHMLIVILNINDYIAFDILHMYSLYFISIITFTWFDVIGYSDIVRGVYELKRTPLVVYRIIQTIVQWSIFIYVFLYSPYIAILYIMSWWFGLCDHLYYVINDKERDWYFSDSHINMPWLWWTSFGMLKKEWQNNKTSQLMAKWVILVSITIIPIIYVLTN